MKIIAFWLLSQKVIKKSNIAILLYLSRLKNGGNLTFCTNTVKRDYFASMVAKDYILPWQPRHHKWDLPVWHHQIGESLLWHHRMWDLPQQRNGDDPWHHLIGDGPWPPREAPQLILQFDGHLSPGIILRISVQTEWRGISVQDDRNWMRITWR